MLEENQASSTLNMNLYFLSPKQRQWNIFKCGQNPLITVDTNMEPIHVLLLIQLEYFLQLSNYQNNNSKSLPQKKVANPRKHV